MKLSAALGIVQHLCGVVQAALPPTLKALWHTPALFFSPITISSLFMAHVWTFMADGVDENTRAVKDNLITPNAYGVVLDLGAGHGHTAKYLDRAKVSKYIALEPNVIMHPKIRAFANEKGFTESDGSLLILSCGAEDISAVLAALGKPNIVNTLVSILTLCTIPAPEQTLSALVHYALAPGGTFVFCEHVLSPRSDVAWWQRFWTPIWKIALDGCRLDRPTHLWVERMAIWRESDIRGVNDEEENLFLHRIGKCVKS